MKLRTILATGMLAATMVTSASAAATTIHISGSTAFRTSYAKAILDILDNVTYAYDNSGSGTNFKSSAAIYHGNLKSTGAEVYIKTLATGSAAGVVDLAQQNNLTKWIATPATVGGIIPGTTSATLTAGGTNLNGLSPAYSKETAPTEVAMSDDDASSMAKAVATATTGGAAAATAIKNATLVNGGSALNGAGTGAGDAGAVGAVMFVWAAGTQSGTPAYTNMTQQAAAALAKGPIPVSFLIGTNTTDYIFLIGRNEDSGTRIAALAEAQSGFGQGTQQFRASFGSGSSYTDNGQTIQTGGTGATLTGLTLWPANWPLNTAPSISWASAGHSGYVAGGDVGNVLKATGGQKLTLSGAAKPAGYINGTSTAYLVGYVGSADYSSAVGTKLTYNGVAQSIANVQNGSYSFWSFEHLYYRGALADVQKQTADDIADKIYTADAPTNGSGVTDNSGVTSDVAGCLIDSSFLVNKATGVAGSYQTLN